MLSIYSSKPPTNPRSNFVGEERLSGGAAPSARAGGRAAQEEGTRGGHAEAGASPHAEGASGRPAGSGAEQEAGARAGATREGAKHALRPWIQRSGMWSWCSGTIFRFLTVYRTNVGRNNLGI